MQVSILGVTVHFHTSLAAMPDSLRTSGIGRGSTPKWWVRALLHGACTFFAPSSFRRGQPVAFRTPCYDRRSPSPRSGGGEGLVRSITTSTAGRFLLRPVYPVPRRVRASCASFLYRSATLLISIPRTSQRCCLQTTTLVSHLRNFGTDKYSSNLSCCAEGAVENRHQRYGFGCHS